jgi:glycosyltransferase involved in cell wall biosynthesis
MPTSLRRVGASEVRGTMHPAVSVVIPAFNAAAYVNEAIDSVLQQSYKPIEVIVVDDGSEDGTQQVIAPYKNKVMYLRKERGGPSSARNVGIRVASGEWIGLLDADDLWLPNFLEKLAPRKDRTVESFGKAVATCTAVALAMLGFAKIASAFTDKCCNLCSTTTCGGNLSQCAGTWCWTCPYKFKGACNLWNCIECYNRNALSNRLNSSCGACTGFCANPCDNIICSQIMQNSGTCN